METFRTTTCAAHGHPEVTLVLARPLPLPGVASMLLGYFEDAVARGTTFAAGQTVQVGWALLRLCDRDDGTLGVQERELSPEEAAALRKSSARAPPAATTTASTTP